VIAPLLVLHANKGATIGVGGGGVTHP
jgi:hypothetical protein